MSRGLLTTSVGSFAKPPYLQRARNEHAAGRLSDEELERLTRKATKEVIDLQNELGIDILVHGEMERGDMVAYFAEHFPGMKVGGLVRSYGNRYYHKPVITGELRWEKPVTVDLWRYAQSLTDRPVKGMLTGPYTIVEWSFDEHYPDRRAAVLRWRRSCGRRRWPSRRQAPRTSRLTSRPAARACLTCRWSSRRSGSSPMA